MNRLNFLRRFRSGKIYFTIIALLNVALNGYQETFNGITRKNIKAQQHFYGN